MAELVAQDRGKRRNGAAHAAVLVSGYELARHFGCSRQNVELLAEQGVIERRASDGKFDQDVCRLKYLQHLRSERQRSHRGRRLMRNMLRPRQHCCASGSRRSSVPWCGRTKSMNWLTASAAWCRPRCRGCLRGARRVAILRPGATSNASCLRCAPRWPPSASGWPTRTANRRSMSRIDALRSGVARCGACRTRLLVGRR
jgi:hypothetical protein